MRRGRPDLDRQVGARVLETDWPGYREQENRAVDHARNDWVLSVGSDEVVPEALAQEVQDVLGAPGTAGVWMNWVRLLCAQSSPESEHAVKKSG